MAARGWCRRGRLGVAGSSSLHLLRPPGFVRQFRLRAKRDVVVAIGDFGTTDPATPVSALAIRPCNSAMRPPGSCAPARAACTRKDRIWPDRQMPTDMLCPLQHSRIACPMRKQRERGDSARKMAAMGQGYPAVLKWARACRRHLPIRPNTIFYECKQLAPERRSLAGRIAGVAGPDGQGRNRCRRIGGGRSRLSQRTTSRFARNRNWRTKPGGATNARKMNRLLPSGRAAPSAPPSAAAKGARSPSQSGARALIRPRSARNSRPANRRSSPAAPACVLGPSP